MRRFSRARPMAAAALAAALVGLAACGTIYPNTTFSPHTELGRDIDALWGTLYLWGTIVFVLVEAVLIYTVFRYRRREGDTQPRHVHGNTTLEIMWTVIPAVILVFIAVPTVRTIFRTQAKPVANALQVQVIGHQWWWEFRYPQYGVTTANELYLPIGRTANFELTTRDVLHSFWVPQLGGKRDLISNHVNYIWFTPDSGMSSAAWNGTCNEYCGDSHANMRLRAFTVQPAEFDSWIAGQKAAAAMSPALTAPVTAPAAGATPPGAPGAAGPAVQQAALTGTPGAPAVGSAQVTAASATPASAAYVFPREQIPAHVWPGTPLPDGLNFSENLAGDAGRGREIVTNLAKAPCLTCHIIEGEQKFINADMAKGPNLTHVGSRYTIAAGLYPNDAAHLARWIKNARLMKPGSQMPTLGKNQRDPLTGQTVTAGGLDDQQIADIVAYLLALK